MTQAIAGTGAQLKMGDGASSETFTALSEVYNISMGGMSREEIDVTSLDSTDGYREFIQSFKDVGEITFGVNFRLATWNDLYSAWDADDPVNWQLALPDDVLVLSFSAYVMSIPFEPIVPDDKVAMTITLRVTGTITIES